MNSTSQISPFRLWMTGSLAVVMAALQPGRIANSDERLRSPKVSRLSPYDVEETMQRIEQEARGDGMSVLARLDDARHVIVLASSVGGTPVLMRASDGAPDMPLALHVRRHPAGGAEVLVAACAEDRDSDWTELPLGVAEELARLPGVLDRALS
jgi:hypothetical protein